MVHTLPHTAPNTTRNTDLYTSLLFHPLTAGFHNQLEEAQDQNKKQKQGGKEKSEKTLFFTGMQPTNAIYDLGLILSVKWLSGKGYDSIGE